MNKQLLVFNIIAWAVIFAIFTAMLFDRPTDLQKNCRHWAEITQIDTSKRGRAALIELGLAPATSEPPKSYYDKDEVELRYRSCIAMWGAERGLR